MKSKTIEDRIKEIKERAAKDLPLIKKLAEEGKERILKDKDQLPNKLHC